MGTVDTRVAFVGPPLVPLCSLFSPPPPSSQLRINGRWHTWIDYERFQELAASGKPFTGMDYISPTPEWALLGHPARGFDPREVRHRRGKPVDK